MDSTTGTVAAAEGVASQTGRSTPHVRFKPLFPAFYAVIFAATLWYQFLAQLQMPPPLLIEAVNGDKNRAVIWTCLLGLIGVLCVYLFLNYVRLEFLEHDTGRNSAKATAASRMLEFALRFAILVLVTAKILKWNVLTDILLFIALLSMLLLLWSTWMNRKFGEPFTLTGGCLHLSACLFSAASYWIARDPTTQQELGMAIFAAVVVMIIVLGVQLFHLAKSVGMQACERTWNYVTHW